MSTKRIKSRSISDKSTAIQFLDSLNGGPLTFGEMLASVRDCEEVSQVDFAKKLGVSKAHLCDIEKGRRAVSSVRAYEWGKKLGYSPELFVELALQSSLDHDKLPFKVKLEVA